MSFELDAQHEGEPRLQFQNTFDLDEFLAYLFPGSLFLGVLLLNDGRGVFDAYATAANQTSELFIGAMVFVVFLGASLICGHVFSIISRVLWRPLLNWLAGEDPERAIFHLKKEDRIAPPKWPLGRVFGRLDAFFTVELNAKLDAAFQQVYGSSIGDKGIRPAVPRMIRSYAFANSARANASREQIVRSRSICANLATPVLFLAATGPFDMDWIWRVGLLACGILLLCKQRDLDLREAKETYLYFLAITRTELSHANAGERTGAEE